MKIFLDDERPAPEGWIQMYSVQGVIDMLSVYEKRITHLSLDHDLGDNKKTGYDLMCYLEEAAHNPYFYIPEISIHSANPVGRANMMRALDSIKRIRQAQIQQ